MKLLGNFILRISMMAILAAGGVFSATAQELTPDHLELAREYVDLTDNSQIYEITLIETGIQTMRTIVSQNPEISEEVSEAIGVVIQDYSNRKDELFDQFARIYALRFTQAELAEIVAFYKTDVGRKLAVENVRANQDIQNVMRIYQNNLNNEFFAKVRAELREKDIEI